jgi:hypothetical protein
MTIIELLRTSDNWIHIQGRKTRIFMGVDGTFFVHGKSGGPSASYTYDLYTGTDEALAVAAFQRNEGGDL